MLKPDTFKAISLIKKIKTHPDRRRLFENFVSLSVLQALNYILPLITFPYLVRVLGVEKFGLLAFATATIGYFQIITDYGFNLSATREIAINRENKEKVQEIFSAVMLIKFGLMLLSLILLVVLVVSFNKFRQDWEIYLLTFGMVVGNTLFPVWFFQGMERMKYITFLNIIIKGLFTVAIFLFVKEQTDYWKVPLLNGMGFLVAGLISLIIVYFSFKIKIFLRPSYKSIILQLQNGWYNFMSIFVISLYVPSRIFIVGLFFDNTITGYYSIAEKIMKIVQTFPLSSLLQAIYPKMSRIYSESKTKAYQYMIKLQRVCTISYAVITFLCFLFAENIVTLITGHSYQELITVLKILFITIFFINANAFKIQFFLIAGLNDLHFKIHLYFGLVGLILIILSAYFIGFVGPAISILLIEAAILINTSIKLKEVMLCSKTIK